MFVNAVSHDKVISPMKSRLLSLLIMLCSQHTVFADDVMSLFDQVYKLHHEAEKQQILFLIQKDDSLKDFPLAFFDKPEQSELFDRVAFEYLWKKGNVKKSFDSWVIGQRWDLTPEERKEVVTSHPEFANFREVQGPRRYFVGMPEAKAQALCDTIYNLYKKYQKELDEISSPIDRQANAIDGQIGIMCLKQGRLGRTRRSPKGAQYDGPE